jgi:hypothetical protein
MKRTLSIFLVITISTLTLSAQREETLFGKNGFEFSGAWGAATYNYSFFEEDYVFTRGGYGGLEFGNTFFLGYGWFRFRENAEPIEGNRFTLKYHGIMLGIAPGAHKVAHPRITMLIGGGKARLDGGPTDRVFVFQPSAGLEINVFGWFRVGAEGGYRIVANENLPGLSARDLSSPFAQLDLRFGFSWGR